MLFSKVAAALVALIQFQTVTAAPQPEIRSDVCSISIYGELVPYLKQHRIAVEYCKAV